MLPATQKEIEPSSLTTNQICHRFSLEEIRSATQNFSEAFVIGRGGFGKVYKGHINNGSATVVAIKRSNSVSDQGAPEFRTEIEMLSMIRHCNLVSLIGYCNEGAEMALVYEYMPHGTLEDHLHKGSSPPLSWLQLLKICIGAARGLEYLHTGTGTQHGIMHRDVKSSNVLLDENFSAKLSDFGLAKVGPTNQTRTHVSTRVKGTFGYMDPCYVYTGKLTRKSDVYSFGVVLLEVMCGRPAVDSSLDEDQWGLALWAQSRIREGKLNHIIDSRLKGQISSKCLKEFAHIACRCLHDQPKQRPTMAEIVARLDVILSLQERLDFSATENKFIDKVLLFFWPKVDTKASNLISARSSGSESIKPISFNVLKKATSNFRLDAMVGEGGLPGVVSKGWMDDQLLVAAKPGTGTAISVMSLFQEDLPSNTEWFAETDHVGILSHPNLVKLIGYCLNDDCRFLVCEFLPKGTLGNHLFRRPLYLSWNLRIKVALGAAKGLAYLHSPEAKVIFGDFKSSSILLDSDYNAKLFILPLSKDEPLADDIFTVRQVMGTVGCATPEHIAKGDLTVESDIYAFGMVFLEILTGRRCIDENRPYHEQILVEFAKPYLKSKRGMLRIMDPKIDGQYSSTVVSRAAKLAMKCLSEEPKHRPTADNVVEALEQLQKLQKAEQSLIRETIKKR